MICVFLAEGFESLEAISVVDILKRANCEVKTVGIGSKTVTSSDLLSIRADLTDDEVKIEDIDVVILPGGMPGSQNLKESPFIKKVLTQCCAQNKLIAAICAAPFVLGEAGLLKGKKAVCYPGFENEKYGAIYVDEPVCVDGNIITAKGPGVAMDFAFAIVNFLCGEKVLNEIKNSMQCRS